MFDETFVLKLVKDFSDLQNICELTSGGQKYVFKALHKQYGNVVLKIIKPNPNVYRRTKREIRAAQIISSQNVPIIFESNIEQESTEYFWIIEEFIEGLKVKQNSIVKARLFSIVKKQKILELISSLLESFSPEAWSINLDYSGIMDHSIQYG